MVNYQCIVKRIGFEKEATKKVTEGFETALNRKKCEVPPRKKLLDGEQEAKLIALRLGSPPDGFGKWSLRLLAEQVVELEIVDSISHETVRRTLKKMG